MKSTLKYRVLTLVAGIATACLIIFSQLFYFQAATYCQKKAESRQQEQQAPETGKTSEAYISIPSNTISSVSIIQLSEGLTLLVEILPEPREIADAADPAPLTNRFFQTLFRFIISANAP